MIKTYKPTTPSRRTMQTVDYSGLTKTRPERSLLVKVQNRAGHGYMGRITAWHRGGGNKKLYRLIDFKLNKFDIPAIVRTIEYDPYRTAFIALVCYRDGEKRYILAPHNLKVGDSIVISHNALPIKIGNRMPLKYIPIGTFIHNAEFFPNGGAKLIKSAGSWGEILAQDNEFTHVKLPSGEIRKFFSNSLVTIGQISNVEHNLEVLGKAGKSRHRGIRPKVRGTAQNPVDHPHGGGEGRCPIGLKHPKTPWGKPALGHKTRKRGKKSNLFIVRRKNKK